MKTKEQREDYYIKTTKKRNKNKGLNHFGKSKKIVNKKKRG